MAEQKATRAVATRAAAKIPQLARENLAATVRAKKEGKKVAYAFIFDAA